MRSYGRGGQRGVAIIETAIALPILLAVILGAIQFGLIYEAKATLNYAALQAARSGAVSHAELDAIRQGLARGIVPLYSPDSSLGGFASALARATQDLATGARIRILNPTREAFDDFGQDVEGQRELPNDHLQSRSTTVGARSGLNIQDANLLRVQITYGYELKVPLVNWFITRTLLAFRGSRAMDPFEQQLLRRTYLPIVATSTVRMQSPAHLNDAMVSRDDLRDGERFAADTPPPDPADDNQQGDDDADSDEDPAEEGDRGEGSSLADGFFGFGSGHGTGTTEAGGPGNGQGSGSEGGPNSGNPQTCDGSGASSEQPMSAPQPLPDLLNESTSADATLPNRLPSLSVGNPIHVVTGNKYQHEIDIPALPERLGLSFSRYYNSELSDRSGSLGAGWRHNFDAHLQVRAGEGDIEITQADGRSIKFVRVGAAHYRAQRAGDGQLFVKPTPCSTLECPAYTWRWDSGRELTFDDAGDLKTIRDGALAMHLLYDAHHHLRRVADPEARVLTLHYDRKGRISSLQLTGGALRKFKYDRRDNLVEVIATDHRARKYHYEDARHPHHMTGISAGIERLANYGQASASFERIATWAYDDQGRGVLSTHAMNADKVTLRFEHGFTDVTDSFGRVSRYVTEIKDGVALVSEVQGPGCSVCGPGDVSYTYSDAYSVTDQHVKGQAAYRYEYDAQRRLLAIYRDALLVAKYVYEGDATEPNAVELPSVNPNEDHRIEIVARANGRPTQIRETGFEPSDAGFSRIERTYRLTYDAMGQLLEIDGPRENAQDVTTFEYDEFHRLISVRDPDGNEQRVLKRDEAGRPTLVSGTGRPTIRMSYDVEGRLTSFSTDAHDGSTIATQLRYDARGRLNEIEFPDHRIRHVDFDAANRITGERTIEGLTKITRYAFDGQVIQQSLLDNGVLLKTLHFAFDGDRRLTEVRDGDGPALQQLQYIGTSHSPADAIDALGRRTHFTYDPLGSIDSVTDATAATTKFQRDSEQRVTAVESPNGISTQFEYDDFGRKVEARSPDRGTTRYRYDAANHLIQSRDARGRERTFEYSRAGLLERLRDSEGESKLSYRGGHLVSTTDPNSEQRFDYDDGGRLLSTEIRIGRNRYATELRYDELGRVAKKKLFSGQWLSQIYDERGSLAAIRLDKPLQNQKVVERAAPRQTRSISPLSDLRFGNGLVVRNVVDADGRISSRSDGVSNLQYTYDDEHRITILKADGRAQSFGYDAADRLTSNTTPNILARYQYDVNGNRTSTTYGSRSTQYEYDRDSNRLIAVSGDKVSYDAVGNIKSIGDRSYEYNSAGRPVRLRKAGKLIAEYLYDSSGERIRKVDYSQGMAASTEYLYERHKLVAEADASGQINREYIYLDQHPIAVIDRGELFWIHTDHLGAPIAVTDVERRVIWRAEYEPFGHAEVDADPDRDGKFFELNLRRPGQYADRESGTYYNYYRDYDPSLGRYLTPDPLGITAGTNTYAYAHSDPINRFDALGLYDEMIHYYMTYFLALAAGIPQDIARTLAIAAQYVDENYLTQPVRGFAVPNSEALPLYHFVMDATAPNLGDRTNDPLTRFYNPQSQQLSLLRASTDPEMLQRLWMSLKQNEGACPMPYVIQNARYQLYGEYMHAYEDTFAHRDAYNMPYSVKSNSANTPVSWVGHGGPGVPDWFGHAPDHTYNQNYRSPSACTVMVSGEPSTTFNGTRDQCEAAGGVYYPAIDKDETSCDVRYALGGSRTLKGLTQSQCMARGAGPGAVGATFHPGSGDIWQYNELRTLRMEYELFDMLQKDFAKEIQANVDRPGTGSWITLAGREWGSDPNRNARLGVTQSFEDWSGSQNLSAEAVLQRYNAADSDEDTRLNMLNAWLRDHDFLDASGNVLRIERWSEVKVQGASQRWTNIGWLPGKSIAGVLLPRDELCINQAAMDHCDDRPRR